NYRNASGNRGAECNVLPILGCQADQFGPRARDELLVGGDNRLAPLERPSDPIARRIQAADQFDNDVGIGREHFVNFVRPAYVGWNPVTALTLEVSVENVREAQACRRVLDEYPGHRTAHRTKTDNRN